MGLGPMQVSKALQALVLNGPQIQWQVYLDLKVPQVPMDQQQELKVLRVIELNLDQQVLV